MRVFQSSRSGDEIETLKSDLRSLMADLQEVGRDVGTLSSRLASEWRQRAPTGTLRSMARDWRGAGDDLQETWSGLRGHGERSASALRGAVHARPLTVVLGALAIGYAMAYLLGRRSADQ